jgi:sterol desaturase/sphingolipid hydroxylase (fatty acid hydroxylase superfamily)
MEDALRTGAFVAVFALVAWFEMRAPRRPGQTRRDRWVANLGILLVDVVLMRLTVGAAAYATALAAEAQGWGLLRMTGWSPLLTALAALVLLDLAIYLQHVMSHALPAFWRLHQVHHADLEVDATTGIRFHPIEIIVSMLWKAAVVAGLGADPWVVIVYEAMLNLAAVWTHGNIRVPGAIDRRLRWVLCTPDMHRVHHSVVRAETDSNYGNILSVWDRLFGTYREAPAAGQLGAVLGLAEYRAPLSLPQMLLLPFRRRPKPPLSPAAALPARSGPDAGNAP